MNKSCSDAQEEMPGALPLTATSQRSPLWKKGETIYVDVATWYRPGTCPFPRNEKWLVEGKILKICDKYKRFTLSFPVFDEQHDMTLFYMKVSISHGACLAYMYCTCVHAFILEHDASSS